MQRTKLSQSLIKFLTLGECFSVPVVDIFKERNPFSLKSFGDYHRRFLVRSLRSVECRKDFIKIVTINADGLPTKRLKTLAVRINIEGIHSSLTLPKRIDIHNPNQIIKLVV